MNDMIMCPKCKQISGDDWSQCFNNCPMRESPHYNEVTQAIFGEPIPYDPDIHEELEEEFGDSPNDTDIPF